MISEKINLIKEIEQLQELIAIKEQQLNIPFLTDFNQIPVIYKWFLNISENLNQPYQVGNVIHRKKFLFIILLLYSPGTLIGKPMLRGLRDKLAKTLKLSSRSTISDNCANLIIYYNSFKEYRNDIDLVYQQLFDQIQAVLWDSGKLKATHKKGIEKVLNE